MMGWPIYTFSEVLFVYIQCWFTYDFEYVFQTEWLFISLTVGPGHLFPNSTLKFLMVPFIIFNETLYFSY